MFDGNTIYFIVFGVVAFLVVVLFGRKDPAKFEERKKAIMESMEVPDSEPPAEKKHDADKPR